MLALTLTLAVWLIALRFRTPGVPPLLTAAAALAILVPALRIHAAEYARGTAILVALLGPAVVALAVPLYLDRAVVVRRLVPTLTGILAGATAGVVTAVLVGRAMHLPDLLIRALAPRAATAPVAASVASSLGGDPHLAAAAAVLGGALGAILAPLVVRFANDPRDGGLALGVAAHGIGTARAAELDTTAGASAATAMALNAVATAIVAPIVVFLLLR